MGLGLLASGCSRPPAERRPAAVFVSADSLVTEYPQWDDVLAMDRQIASLRRYVVHQPQQTLISAVTFPSRPAIESSTHISELESSIQVRLNEVYELQKAALADRLSKQHRETRSAEVLADRNAIFAAADADMKRVLDVTGLKIRNLDIRLEAYDALLRSYSAQGWDPKDLSQKRKLIADQVVAENSKAWAQTGEVLQGLKAKLGARDDEETAAALKWMRENSQAQIDLQRESDRQKSLLLSALSNIGKPMGIDTGARPAVVATNSAGPGTLPALPPPQLDRILDSLVKRRSALVEYLGRATRATVRSAASRRGQSVEFAPRPGLPDKTEDYRAVVQMAPTRLGGVR